MVITSGGGGWLSGCRFWLAKIADDRCLLGTGSPPVGRGYRIIFFVKFLILEKKMTQNF